MRYKFLTIPVFRGEWAEDELNQFLAQHQVLSLERQFIDDGAASAWSVCVAYVPHGDARPGAPEAAKKDKVDYKEALSASDFEVYRKLRDVRNAMAAEAGLQPYNIFTNEQVARLVTERVTTAAAFARVPGIGKARLEKYVPIFLPILQAELQSTLPPPSEAGSLSAADAQA